jgi:hypothetical protein
MERNAMTFWSQCLQLFSATKSFRNLAVSWEDLSLNNLFNSIKFELNWLKPLPILEAPPTLEASPLLEAPSEMSNVFDVLEAPLIFPRKF